MAEKPARELLIECASTAELWHDADHVPFATIDKGSHRENHPLKSNAFRLWLSSIYYDMTESGAPKQAIDEALHALEAKAVHRGSSHNVAIRIAEHDGATYLDLGDEDWRVAEITGDGWKVIADPPVRFIRTSGMRALPVPVRGGSVDDLRAMLNYATEADFKIMVAWLLSAFRPGRPFPILVLNGEQGSAKSTTSRLLRNLVDPSGVPNRSVPREERDLVASARNNWVLVYDNLSGVPPWLSDTLCRIATGGGLGGRALYTDHDEAVFEAMRPVIINGIPDLAARPDLADRALVLRLLPISEENRQSEDDFWSVFDELKPGILGALLDAVGCAIRRLPSIRLNCKPRMADFATWATAAEEALGWQDGAFMRAYQLNREVAIEATIEADAVATAIRELAGKHGEWIGAATELLSVLRYEVPDEMARSNYWPKSSSALSNRIRRAAPNLRHIGVQIEYFREGHDGNRMLRIQKVPQNAVSAVSNVGKGAESLEIPADGDADGPVVGSVSHNPPKTNGADDADAADGDFTNPNTWGLYP